MMKTDEMLEKYDVRVMLGSLGVTINVKRRSVDEDFREFTIEESRPMLKDKPISDLTVIWTRGVNEFGDESWVFVNWLYGSSFFREHAQILYDEFGDAAFDLMGEDDVADILNVDKEALDEFLSMADMCIEWLEKQEA